MSSSHSVQNITELPHRPAEDSGRARLSVSSHSHFRAKVRYLILTSDGFVTRIDRFGRSETKFKFSSSRTVPHAATRVLFITRHLHNSLTLTDVYSHLSSADFSRGCHVRFISHRILKRHCDCDGILIEIVLTELPCACSLQWTLGVLIS